MAAICSGVVPGGPPSRVMIGVSLMPGLSTLTRMRHGSSSTDNERARERTAAFAAVYIEVPNRACLSASQALTRMTEGPVAKTRQCLLDGEERAFEVDVAKLVE